MLYSILSWTDTLRIEQIVLPGCKQHSSLAFTVCCPSANHTVPEISRAASYTKVFKLWHRTVARRGTWNIKNWPLPMFSVCLLLLHLLCLSPQPAVQRTGIIHSKYSFCLHLCESQKPKHSLYSQPSQFWPQIFVSLSRKGGSASSGWLFICCITSGSIVRTSS